MVWESERTGHLKAQRPERSRKKTERGGGLGGGEMGQTWADRECRSSKIWLVQRLVRCECELMSTLWMYWKYCSQFALLMRNVWVHNWDCWLLIADFDILANISFETHTQIYMYKSIMLFGFYFLENVWFLFIYLFLIATFHLTILSFSCIFSPSILQICKI